MLPSLNAMSPRSHQAANQIKERAKNTRSLLKNNLMTAT